MKKIASLYHDTANLFEQISNCSKKMTEIRSGAILDEQIIEKFCNSETRKLLVETIQRAKEYEARVIQNIASILKLL